MSARTEKVSPKASSEALLYDSQKMLGSIAAAGLYPADEIKLLDELILRAKARRNMIIPIAIKLPVEILGEIFEYYVCDSDSERKKRQNSSWAFLMLVCRSWREVAINHPALWTNLGNHNTKLWPTFIARSHSLALSVKLSTDGTVIGDTLAASLAELHRIHSFELRAPQSLLEQVLPQLNSAAPKLVHLTLVNRSDGWCRALEGDFVSTHAPELRSLSLDGVSFPWGHRASNLQSLTIERQIRRSRLRIGTESNASDMLYSLSSPSLLAISIRDIPGPSPQNLAAPVVVAPNRLTLLGLRSTAPEVALPLWFSTSSILGALPNAYIGLRSLPADFTPLHLDRIVTHAAAHMANHPHNVTKLHIQFGTKFSIDTDMLTFIMPAPTFESSFGHMLLALFAATNPDHLMSLEIELREGIDVPIDALEAALSRAPSVVNLKLSVTPATLHSLSRLLSRHAVQGSVHEPLLPALQTLSLSGVDLTKQYEGRPIYTFVATMLHWRRLRAPILGPSSINITQTSVTSTVATNFSVGGSISVNYSVWSSGNIDFTP
ncbi:unnamed protein product [Peniophora sp. CBMAI 1063]|nr:unnamed protein product [Peniophora sp. CBMAI 1063]